MWHWLILPHFFPPSPESPALQSQLDAILHSDGLLGIIHPDIQLQWTYVHNSDCVQAASMIKSTIGDVAAILGVVDELCRRQLEAAFTNTTMPLMFLGRGNPSDRSSLPNSFTLYAPYTPDLLGIGHLTTFFNWRQPAILTTSALSEEEVLAFSSVGISRTVVLPLLQPHECPASTSVEQAVSAIHDAFSPMIVLDV